MNSSQKEEASMCKVKAFMPVEPWTSNANKVIIVPVAGKPVKKKIAKKKASACGVPIKCICTFQHSKRRHTHFCDFMHGRSFHSAH